jgi:hypothetical protein
VAEPETTRFAFRLESASFREVLRIENPHYMVGLEIPVNWGRMTATGRIVQVDGDEDGITVTMEIDQPLDVPGPWPYGCGRA